MVLKDKGVQIKVSKDFFNNVFEPARTNMEKQLGVRISQRELTSMVAKSGMNFTPKLQRLIQNGKTQNRKKKR